MWNIFLPEHEPGAQKVSATTYLFDMRAVTYKDTTCRGATDMLTGWQGSGTAGVRGPMCSLASTAKPSQ